ncbi:CDP-glucose 4,6-dehydratase [Roseibium sp. MMSF_3544]|uniref:CDP-glucose 4,6-dehydratase n=1 Tax=unclassified Roseibium TaxID=2629323 RepID=UPI00273EC83D|nr:CDP-glucose 4,6-dehydratase [Roseibium sp. MMSF_3544]
MLRKKFWQGKRVLVTGHTGFKGSWLLHWLKRLGANVSGLALDPESERHLYVCTDAGNGLENDFRVDLRDPALVRDAIDCCSPQIVFHLAAQPLVRLSYDSPLETFETNVMGTAYLLDALRTVTGLEAIVIITSDKCYDNKEWVWGYRENEAMGGKDPYSASKGAAEILTASYRHSFFAQNRTGLATARAGNVIGGGDWAIDRLVPDIVGSFMKNETAIIRNPHAIRPWQHVLEPLSGYMLLAERLAEDPKRFGEGWNFGPNVEGIWEVRKIADILKASWGGGADWRTTGHADAEKKEARILALDNSKALFGLGWRPVWDTRTALQRTVDWYRSFHDGEDLKALTLAQINEYETALSSMEQMEPIK